MIDKRFAEGQLYSVFSQGNLSSVTLQGEFAYINLGGPVRGKIELKEAGIEMTILCCTSGTIDKSFLSFEYILGKRKSRNQPDRIITPMIHEHKDGWGRLISTEWYEYELTNEDYSDIFNTIDKYISAFRLQ